MTAHPNQNWSDHELLVALDMAAHQGASASEIARTLGRSRNSVIGALNRVRHESAKVPDACIKPENRDGGGGRFWWVRGEHTNV